MNVKSRILSLIVIYFIVDFFNLYRWNICNEDIFLYNILGLVVQSAANALLWVICLKVTTLKKSAVISQKTVVACWLRQPVT